MEYLGYIITGQGVSTDLQKVTTMKHWPKSKTLKEMKGFLGLTDYYRWFIRGYGVLSNPLTTLLKKDNFHWGIEADKAFEELKEAMTQAPMLALLDFSKEFVLEMDACDVGIGVVLSQEGRPVSYLSQALAPRHLGLNIYDKELLALIVVVDKWRYYLEGRRFIIRIDHESLKFFSQQRAHNQLQWKGITKLRGMTISFSTRGVKKT